MINRPDVPIPQDRPEERLTLYFFELAELTVKRDSLRVVYRQLQTQFEKHPNLCHWLHSMERSAAAMERRMDMILKCLDFGVL